MKYLLVLFLVVFSISAFAADGQELTSQNAACLVEENLVKIDRIPLRDDADDVDVLIEDFEDELDGWTTADFAGSDTVWHKSDFNERGEDDALWWCGDTLTFYDGDPVGYDNNWLQYLDTPVLDLSEAGDDLLLTFDAWWLLEDPRLVPDYLGDYDCYDGWLVMVSTNAGEDFEPLIPTAPEYYAEMIRAAGNNWDIGELPGWYFISTNEDEFPDTTCAERPEVDWVECTFDMSEYASEEIVVRFMIISDGSVAAPYDNVYLQESGICIDNILIAEGEDVYLSNNADEDPVPSEMLASHGHPPSGGDNWARTDAEAHGGSWSMWNDPRNHNSRNALDSPPMEIPEEMNTFFRFWVYCNLEDVSNVGGAPLEDFYQIFLSDDEGETWIWQVTAYNRTGGDDWAHYVPGTPYGNANIDMDLTDWAGQSIQLRWLFIADNDDDQGIGDGLFIDDIEVLGVNRQAIDAGMANLTVPFPATVGFRLEDVTVEMSNLGINPLNNIYAKWGWDAPTGQVSFPIIPRPNLDPETMEVLELTDFGDNRVIGWTPSVPGSYPVWAATNVGSGTNDEDDDDMAPENDSARVNVDVWPQGLFELGFDSRSAQYSYMFEENSGPAARFSTDIIGQESGVLAAVRLMFYTLEEAVSFNLHIFDEGEDGSSPGDEELLNLEVEVTPENSYPNWLDIPLFAALEEGQIDIEGDFWVWAELLQDTLPSIVGNDQVLGEGRFYNFDSDVAVEYNSDLLMRAVVVPEAINAPIIVASTDLVDFDEVIIGQTGEQMLRLYSTGFEPLTISDVTVNGDIFTVDWQGETVLNFGEFVEFAIIFAPEAEELYQESLTVESDAEAAPEVQLVGGGMINSVENGLELPGVFSLSAPYPNPFNSTTRIDFSLKKSGRASLQVFDIRGRLIIDLAQGDFGAGSHSTVLNAESIPAGLYFVRLQANQMEAVTKVLLMK